MSELGCGRDVCYQAWISNGSGRVEAGRAGFGLMFVDEMVVYGGVDEIKEALRSRVRSHCLLGRRIENSHRGAPFGDWRLNLNEDSIALRTWYFVLNDM